MKKYFFSMLMVFATVVTFAQIDSTSQSKEVVPEQETPSQNPVVDFDKVATAVKEVPTFADADVQNYANEYSKYLLEVIDANKNGDAKKMQNLQPKAEELNKKSTLISTKLTAEDNEKFMAWSNKINAASH